MVTPPAVSAKMPSVRASSPMPSMISSSVTAAHEPPERRMVSRAYQPSAGLPMASDLAIVRGLTGPDGVGAAEEGRGHGRAALGLGARHPHGGLLGQEAHLAQLGEPLGHLGQLAARSDGDHDMVRGLPAELLGDLEGQRLGAFGVVGPHVDVDEGPTRALARQLGAQAVDVVVVPLDGDDRPAVDGRHGDLGRLEVVRDEDDRVHARSRRVGGHRVGQVAGRRAGRHLEAQLPGLGEGDRDHPVLERARRVGGVVLDPELAQPELGGQAIGPDQRREAGTQVHRRGVVDREQVPVAPDGAGTRLDALPADGRRDPLVVVGDLQRPEAVVADVQRLGGKGALTLTTTQPSDEISHRSSSSVGHWHQVLRTGCRDVDGPVPQSLWMMGVMIARPGRPPQRSLAA